MHSARTQQKTKKKKKKRLYQQMTFRLTQEPKRTIPPCSRTLPLASDTVVFRWHATKSKERAFSTSWNGRTSSLSRDSDLHVSAQKKTFAYVARTSARVLYVRAHLDVARVLRMCICIFSCGVWVCVYAFVRFCCVFCVRASPYVFLYVYVCARATPYLLFVCVCLCARDSVFAFCICMFVRAPLYVFVLVGVILGGSPAHRVNPVRPRPARKGDKQTQTDRRTTNTQRRNAADISFSSGVGLAKPCAQVGRAQPISLEIQDGRCCDTPLYEKLTPGCSSKAVQSQVLRAVRAHSREVYT